MPNLVTYIIDNMRVLPVTEKVAAKNPDRVLTVAGVFHSTNANGKRGEKLSFASKAIDREDALAEGFAIDLANGTLTIPVGERGRKATESLTADAVGDILAALRTETAE